MFSSTYQFFVRSLYLVALLAIPVGLPAQNAPDDGQRSSEKREYTYKYRNRIVQMTPVDSLVALNLQADQATVAAANVAQQMKLDMIKPDVFRRKEETGLRVFKFASGDDGTQSETVASLATKTNQEVQPVFVSGQALLIPNDEIIVGFRNSAARDRVVQLIESKRESQDIAEVKQRGKKLIIVRINSPALARNYEVARFLSTNVEEIAYVEPNHSVLFFDKPAEIKPLIDAQPLNTVPQNPKPLEPGNPQGAIKLNVVPFNGNNTPVAGADNSVWETLLLEDFSSPNVQGWTTGSHNASQTTWGISSLRGHKSPPSLYATSGGTGAAAPGPYPNGVFSWVETPAMDFKDKAEIYVELWFFARYQAPSSTGIHDYGSVHVRSGANIQRLGYLAVGYTGNLTEDSTSDSGWRRALFRIPSQAKLDDSRIQIQFSSDSSGNAEGLYVDEIRVVALDDWDNVPPLTQDQYSRRQYELQNVGQIAGNGGKSNDLQIPEAWAEAGEVSDEIVVAVIDDGVSLGHPDLNLVPGCDWDGTGDGHARGSHGTACAGNIGAIKDNDIGVVGTAPNVKIMPIYSGGTVATLAESIDTAVSKEADILSNSWGFGDDFFSATIDSSVRAALDADHIVLFAAGNGPDRSPFDYKVAFPGNMTEDSDVICVGASSPTDEHKAAASSDGAFGWGSSFVGAGPDVTAPSPWSYTTDRVGVAGYNDGGLIEPASSNAADYTPTFGGTSSSTPKVAGVVALMLTVNKDLTPGQVKKILKETATDIEANGEDNLTGAGRVDALAAVRKAAE